MAAGRQESTSQASHLLTRSRTGTPFARTSAQGHTALDGLTDAFSELPMGLLTEQVNDEDPNSREDQDVCAAASQQRAVAGWDARILAEVIVPGTVTGGRGAGTLVDRDESARPSTAEDSSGTLRAAFRSEGRITAGNASRINDGAWALEILNRETAEARGLEWIAEIGPAGTVAGPDASLQLQPARAVRQACDRAGIDPADLDLLELNEAFAAVSLASARELGVEQDRVNVNGGAIALGHPIGMSGARIVLHLALELQRRGGGIGAAALCGGGDQGALVLRVPDRAGVFRVNPAAGATPGPPPPPSRAAAGG